MISSCVLSNSADKTDKSNLSSNNTNSWARNLSIRETNNGIEGARSIKHLMRLFRTGITVVSSSLRLGEVSR